MTPAVGTGATEPALLTTQNMGSEKRGQMGVLRKAHVKAVEETKQRKAPQDVNREQTRIPAGAGKLCLETLYREFLEARKLPEDLARSLILREGRRVIDRNGPPIRLAGPRDVHDGSDASIPAPMGNYHD